MSKGNVIIQNKYFRLTLDGECKVKSLVYLPTGEECAADEDMPLFSVTQDRPFHNEIKLAYMNKRTAFAANSVKREGNTLTVGFELLPYHATVEVDEREEYVSFTLKSFTVHEDVYASMPLTMDLPPVREFRLIQLPLKHRERFGEWLNVSTGGGVSIGVMATSPCERIDSERRKSARVLTADAVADLKLEGATAILALRDTEHFLDSVAAFEEDFDLPRGAKSRRSEYINRGAYWVTYVTPENIDEHIALAKRGGFTMMLFYYTAFFREAGGWAYNGDYDLMTDIFPRGYKDVEDILAKLRAAGIHAGLHFLHTHIGMKSRYVTPVPDRRLALKMKFTLARDVGEEDSVIYVDGSTARCPKHEKCRVVRVGDELISYERASVEYPYRLEGCVRGYNGTRPSAHRAGELLGVLDLSEYGGTSTYLDQNTDLQDEIGDKLAALYDLGFEFVYFDGSEGTAAPYEYHVPNAQYRVYKKFKNPPLYCEGAAKAHFGWHILSGGNAFDVFPTDIFKRCITEFPFAEAAMMRDNFTRVNFGWWAFRDDTRPDVYEFGTSRAAAWDSPVTVMAGDMSVMKRHPRCEDILEVVRRWEDVRAKKWLTEEQKEMLRTSDGEFTLLINEDGEYELTPYSQIDTAIDGLTAFVFERRGRSYVTLWHNRGEVSLRLPELSGVGDLRYEREIGGEALTVTADGSDTVINVSSRAYLSASAPADVLIRAITRAGE